MLLSNLAGYPGPPTVTSLYEWLEP